MIKINLLAETKPTKKKKGAAALGAAGKLNIFLLLGAILLGGLAIFIQWWVLNSQIKDYDEKIRVAQAEVTRLESILKEVKDFEDKKARLQKKVDLINQLKTNQRGPVRLMDEVSKALPDLLWLERMEYHGASIGLTGKALNPNAVANFLENLKRVPSFQEPTLRDITSCGTSLYCFNLGFTFSNLDKLQNAPPPPPPAAGEEKKEPSAAPAGGPPKAEAVPRPGAPAPAVAAGK